MLDDDAPPVEPPVIRVIAMPADTNPHGDIFGGWLMSQMDLAAGNVASRFSKGRVVTVAVEAMAFIRPVSVGDEVSVYARIIRSGRTSMRIGIEAWRRAREGEESLQVTKAEFTFVAIDEEGKSRPLAR
jgi:acyl-CoA thioesterase YciA